MRRAVALAIVCTLASAASAATPRTALSHAAFVARDKAAALAEIDAAEATALATLATLPNDREAQKMRAMAVGYRAKLTSNRSDALLARKLFDALAASDPRDPEAQAAVGSWHIDALSQLGSFLAGAALSANRKAGLAAIDRSVALGGNRALFVGLAALLRTELDPGDPQVRSLANAAVTAPTPTPLDAFVQRAAAALLVPIKAGDFKRARRLAELWLPLGRIAR